MIKKEEVSGSNFSSEVTAIVRTFIDKDDFLSFSRDMSIEVVCESLLKKHKDKEFAIESFKNLLVEILVLDFNDRTCNSGLLDELIMYVINSIDFDSLAVSYLDERLNV